MRLGIDPPLQDEGAMFLYPPLTSHTWRGLPYLRYGMGDGRVCYIPGHLDPPSLRGEGDRPFHHPRLTPNSINVHERLLQVSMDARAVEVLVLLPDAIRDSWGKQIGGPRFPLRCLEA